MDGFVPIMGEAPHGDDVDGHVEVNNISDLLQNIISALLQNIVSDLLQNIRLGLVSYILCMHLLSILYCFYMYLMSKSCMYWSVSSLLAVSYNTCTILQND